MTSESPFSPALFERSAFLETVGGGEALRRLDAGLGAREPFLLLTGESGTGKTTLVHEAIARWESRVTAVFLAYPTLNATELLEEIVLRFGGEPEAGASRPRVMACLERSLTGIAGRGQTAMLVVDDAHRLPTESLEELRLLVNAVQQARLTLEVLLVGSPELETILESFTLAALRERLSVRAKLEPLSPGETRRYLRHRVSAVGDDGAALFPRKICNEIAALTGGVPRRINTLAGEALRLARDAGAATIGDEHLRAAAQTLAGTMPARALEEPDEVERVPSPNPSQASPVAKPRPNGKADVKAKAKTPSVAAAPPAPPPTRPAPPAVEPAAAAPAAEPARSRVTLEAEEGDPPVIPASHDPNEWVSRFVGDQGPIRIGSQVMAMSASAAATERDERSTVAAAGPSAEDEASPAPPSAARARPRPSNGDRPRVVAYSLVAIAMVSTIALVLQARLLASREESGMAVDANAVASLPSIVTAAEPPRAAVITRAKKPAARDSERSSEPAIASPTGRYTLEVGAVTDLQAAFDERDRLRELTGMDTWVVPAADDLGSHRIVLGIYRSPERAQKAANMLLDTQTLDAATVVPLPRKSERQ